MNYFTIITLYLYSVKTSNYNTIILYLDVYFCSLIPPLLITYPFRYVNDIFPTYWVDLYSRKIFLRIFLHIFEPCTLFLYMKIFYFGDGNAWISWWVLVNPLRFIFRSRSGSFIDSRDPWVLYTAPHNTPLTVIHERTALLLRGRISPP